MSFDTSVLICCNLGLGGLQGGGRLQGGGLEWLGKLMMDFLMSYVLYIQNFMTLRPLQGLKEAQVVHRPGP